MCHTHTDTHFYYTKCVRNGIICFFNLMLKSQIQNWYLHLQTRPGKVYQRLEKKEEKKRSEKVFSLAERDCCSAETVIVFCLQIFFLSVLIVSNFFSLLIVSNFFSLLIVSNFFSLFFHREEEQS